MKHGYEYALLNELQPRNFDVVAEPEMCRKKAKSSEAEIKQETSFKVLDYWVRCGFIVDYVFWSQKVMGPERFQN